MIKKLNNLNFVNIFLIFCSAIFIASRIMVMPTHFTHYDDLFGPYLLDLIQSYDQEYFLQQLQKYLPINQYPDVFYYLLDNSFIFLCLKLLLGAASISIVSTFAPLQFIMTGILILFSNSYESLIILSRLPSLIFSLICLLMVIKISKNFHDRTLRNIFKMCGFFLLTTSWMFLIYSSQGENFILGVLCVFILIYLLQVIEIETLSLWRSVLVGSILSILCFSHYQTFFFLPAFYLAIVIKNNIKFSFISSIKLLPALIINLISVAVIYFIFLRSRLGMNPGVHWNAGFNGEFKFQLDELGFFQGVSYIFEFFFLNSIKVFYGVLGFTYDYNLLAIIYSLILFTLCIVGLKFFLNNKIFNRFFIFILISIITWVILIVNQSLTLSPTRHSLALVPIMILMISAGIYSISQYFNKYMLRQYFFATVFLFASFGLYFSNFTDIYESRRDGFQSVNMNQLIKENNVKHIAAYGHTTNLNFFPFVDDNFSREWINEKPYLYLYSKKDDDNFEEGSYMILCANSDLCGKKNNDEVAFQFLSNLKTFEHQNPQLVYSFQKDSNITNCFSNMAGSGKNRIFIQIFE